VDISELIRLFRKGGVPLFGLFDAARAGGLPKFIGSTGVTGAIQRPEQTSAPAPRLQCLYDGRSATEMASVAPYLIDLSEIPRAQPVLERLLVEGWGKSWGFYFTCPRRLEFDRIRKHLRSFLKVHVEGEEDMFFRFYDPRVLRVFLPTCTTEQRAEFFGPIDAFYVEGENASECLEFRNSANGLKAERHGAA
jgi:hypothetical protein